MLVFSYFYFSYVINYKEKSLNPPKLFGSDISSAIENILAAPDKSLSLVTSIEDRKPQEVEVLKQQEAESLRIWFFLIISSQT